MHVDAPIDDGSNDESLLPVFVLQAMSATSVQPDLSCSIRSVSIHPCSRFPPSCILYFRSSISFFHTDKRLFLPKGERKKKNWKIYRESHSNTGIVLALTWLLQSKVLLLVC
jgi:hypothetical protein